MLKADLEREEQEVALISDEAETRAKKLAEDRDTMAESRRVRETQRTRGAARERRPPIAATQGTSGR